MEFHKIFSATYISIEGNERYFPFASTVIVYPNPKCDTVMMTNDKLGAGGEGGALRQCDSCIPLFNDEWSDVITGFFIVFGVGTVTVRELL